MSTSIEMEQPARRRRARLGAYGLWQLRDYFLDRGAPTFIVASLFGYMFLSQTLPRLRSDLEHIPPRVVLKYGSVEAARSALLHEFSGAFLANFLGVIVFVGALFAMNGIVANDRKMGHYRFLFAKPLAPPAYYGQAFLLHWAGFLAVMTVLSLAYGYVVAPVLSGSLLAALALAFLFYAGLAFVLSAAARWDWLSLVSVTVAANFLWDRYGASRSAFATLLYLLPPVHRTGEVYAAAARGMALPWHALGWLAGYGAACFILGLVVLRYRRLAII